MWYEKLALVLAAIGAINWGLVELGFNLVDLVFASWSETVAMIVYYLVALSGIYALIKAFQ